MRRDLIGLILATLVAQHLARPAPLSACAPAPREGESVAIADEEALIVYNPGEGIEHFIRRAAFRTAAAEFGFLVPTPTVPTLAEAPIWVFDHLTARIAPPVEHRTRMRGVTVASCCLAPFMLTMRAGAERAAGGVPVEVLSTQRVAGYDAAVLRAQDPAALAQWLGAHGYADTPDLRGWLAPYVSQRWVVTAFRVAKADPRDTRSVSTSNVRMTFATERAVYPYREPESQRARGEGPRRLRVHVVTQGRVRGQLGSSGAFPGRVVYARPERDAERLLNGVIPAGWTPEDLWLTSFDDTSSPRPGTDDVWFSRDSSQSEVVPAVVVRWVDQAVPIPVDLLAMGAVGVAWWRRRARRRAMGAR